MLERIERDARAALDGERCFLRRSFTDDALWVSDLPRRTGDTDVLRDIERRLMRLDIQCRTYDGSGLWRLDLTMDGYAALVRGLPLAPPPLPIDDALHPAYALCRLLCLHPAPLHAQPLEPLRAALKRMDGAPQAMLQIIQPTHIRCAELLRLKQPLPSAMGGALALWLMDREVRQ